MENIWKYMFRKILENKIIRSIHMKKILGKILIASLIFTLTACGSKESKEVAKTQNKEQKLVIYSTHPENLIEAVASEFQKETGIEVDYINLKGALADRVLAEKDAPQADIMYGGASSLFIDLSKKDVFEKTNPSWAKDLNPLISILFKYILLLFTSIHNSAVFSSSKLSGKQQSVPHLFWFFRFHKHRPYPQFWPLP